MSEAPQTAEGFLYAVAEDLIVAHHAGVPLACTVRQNIYDEAYVCTWNGLPGLDADQPSVNLIAYHRTNSSAKSPLRLRILQIDIDDALVNIRLPQEESRISPADTYMWRFISSVGHCVTAERRYGPGQPAYPLTLCYEALVQQHNAALTAKQVT